MNSLSQIVLLFCALVTHTTSYGMNYTPVPSEINGIITWTEPNCQGTAALSIFNGTTLSRNISNACLSLSFELLRPLQDQEQLDISISHDLDSWYPYEGQSSTKSLSCTSFIQSYFPVNETEGCHNTPPFTCHRLWINHGLNSALRGPKIFKSWNLPSPLPTTVPSACFAPSSTTMSDLASSSSLSSSRVSRLTPTTELSPLPSTKSQRTSSQPKPPPSSAVATTSIYLTSSIAPTRISASSAIYISSSASASTHVTTTTTPRSTITATIVVDPTGGVITTLIP